MSCVCKIGSVDPTTIFRNSGLGLEVGNVPELNEKKVKVKGVNQYFHSLNPKVEI